MKTLKWVVLIIIALGAAFSIPASRAKLMPLAEPLLKRLGPVGQKISNPTKRWAAKNEETVLLRKLAEEHADHKELPSPLGFQMWIRTNTRGGNKGMDPWGHPYYLVHEGGKIIIGSQGPDRLRNTPDDIRTGAPIE